MTPRAPTREEALNLLGAIERYVVVDCNRPTIRISHALNTLRAFIQGASGEDAWQPTHVETPRGLHTNPDARAWAAFFVQVFPGHKHMEELMFGWFANAMMAMHDSMPSTVSPVQQEGPSEETPIARMNELLEWQGKEISRLRSLVQKRATSPPKRPVDVLRDLIMSTTPIDNTTPMDEWRAKRVQEGLAALADLSESHRELVEAAKEVLQHDISNGSSETILKLYEAKRRLLEAITRAEAITEKNND